MREMGDDSQKNYVQSIYRQVDTYVRTRGLALNRLAQYFESVWAFAIRFFSAYGALGDTRGTFRSPFRGRSNEHHAGDHRSSGGLQALNICIHQSFKCVLQIGYNNWLSATIENSHQLSV